MLRALFIAFFTLSVFAQKTDQIAADFSFSPIFETTKEKKLSDLKGKYVLIDFWATWCRPCVKTMPFLAKVKEQFGDTLTILALSDESLEQQRSHLKNPIEGLSYLADPQGSIIQRFQIDAIPQSVLIGPDGTIKAISHPASFTPQVIKKFMANQKVVLKQPLPETKKTLIQNSTKFALEISPFKPNDGAYVKEIFDDGTTGRHLYFSNMPLKGIYEYLYRMPNRAILKVASLEQYSNSVEASSLFCVDIIIEEKRKNDLFKVAVEELHKRFKLKSRIEFMLSSIKSITVDNISLMPSIVGFELPGLTLDELAEKINAKNIFQMPVQHASPYGQRFNLNISSFSENPIILTGQLQQIGLMIKEEAKEIPQLILFE